MADNIGKKFETYFKSNWLRTMADSTIDRLYDVTMGYKSISQVSDFIGYKWPNIFYIELKTHAGASIPIGNITQYDKLIQKSGIPGVRAGVILFLYEKDTLLYVPISTVKQMKEDGEKSIGMRHLDSNYNIKIIPGTKKRVFIDADYSVLMNTVDGE